MANLGTPQKDIDITTGSGWIRASLKIEISEFGEKVADLLGELFHGIYHISKEIKHKRHKRVEWDREDWIEVVFYKSFSTYDFDELTRFVILCHKYGIRGEIEAAANKYLRLCFYNSGAFVKEHPGLDVLLEKVEKVKNA